MSHVEKWRSPNYVIYPWEPALIKTSATSAPKTTKILEECGKNGVFHWELFNLTWNI